MVELPLALPSIVAGIRVATVVGVGTATIAAFIGAGGLGDYIFRGLSMVDAHDDPRRRDPGRRAGACSPTRFWLGRTATPRAVDRARRRRWLVVAARRWPSSLSLVALRLPAARGHDRHRVEELHRAGDSRRAPRADAGARHGLAVVRRLNLGGTFICDRALLSRRDRHLSVEYTGTALTAIFHQPVAHDRDAVSATTRDSTRGLAITALDPLGFNNTFAILVRRRDAERWDCGRSAICKDCRPLERRVSAEFLQREDGYRGLVAAYGLRFRQEPRVMDLTLMYRALASGQVDVIAGDATSGLIDALDLAVARGRPALLPTVRRRPARAVCGAAAPPGDPQRAAVARRPHLRARHARDEPRRRPRSSRRRRRGAGVSRALVVQ